MRPVWLRVEPNNTALVADGVCWFGSIMIAAGICVGGAGPPAGNDIIMAVAWLWVAAEKLCVP